MNTFVANIDENNLNLINEASKKSGVEYEKGAKMTFDVKMTSIGTDEKGYIFHPIFCESIDEAAILIKEYTAIKVKGANFGKDLILHQVLIKILGF